MRSTSQRIRWLVLALAVATAIAALDVAIDQDDVVLIAGLVVAPFLAAVRLGPVRTGMVGLYTLALALALGVSHSFFGEIEHVVRCAIVVAGALLAVYSASLGERLRRSRDELHAILEGVADGVTAQDPTGRLVFANRAAIRATGFETEEEMLNAPPAAVMERFELLTEDGDPFPFNDLPGRLALQGHEPAPVTVRFRERASGEERWSVVKATPIRDQRGAVVLSINVIEDVTDSKRSERRQRLLAEISKLLSLSLDYETTLRNVAQQSVPEIADWCAMDMLDERGDFRTGAIRRIALATSDPSKLALARRLHERYPPAVDDPQGVAAVLRTGEAQLYPEIPAELLDASARDPEHLRLIRSFNLRSVIIVPIAARGRTLGVITFASGDSGRHFDQDDLDMAQEVADRAAIAIDNARLFSERSHIARALQESLLPPSLPDISGFDVAARFRAAGEGSEVGGDFYDLFDIGDSHWAVVMGDVCGKGADAAAVTALARYTLRAAAVHERRPSAVLRLLNEAMLRQRRDEQFCTVAFGSLATRAAGAQVTVSSGGHPQPLILRASGSVVSAGRPGTLLGVVPDPDLEDDTLSLAPGDALVLYTDGVTEAQAPQRIITLEELGDVLRRCAGQEAATIAEEVERLALGAAGTPRDDIAILVLRVCP